MAANPEITSKLRQEDVHEKNPAAALPDKVDTLVSDFLQVLTGISTETRPVPQPKAETPAENPPPFEIEQAPRVQSLEPAISKEEVCPEPELDLKAIDKEIDATLVEMERHKPAVIQTIDRKDSTPESISPPVKSPKQSVTASTPKPAGKNAAAPAVRKTPEQDWDRLDIFRTEIASSRSSRWRKITYIALAVAALIVILMFFLFFELGKARQFSGQIPDPNLDGSARSLFLWAGAKKAVPPFPCLSKTTPGNAAVSAALGRKNRKKANIAYFARKVRLPAAGRRDAGVPRTS